MTDHFEKNPVVQKLLQIDNGRYAIVWRLEVPVYCCSNSESQMGPVSRPFCIVLLELMGSRQEMQIEVLHWIPSSTIAVGNQRGRGVGKKWSCGEGKDFKASSAAAAQHRSHCDSP